MDLLDRVAGPASDLLDRVDALLATHGAPVGHPVWPLLRQVGAMPGEAFAHVTALDPEVMRSSAGPLAALASDCRSAVVTVPAQVMSQGLAADGYAARWPDLSHQITSDGNGFAERLLATVAYLDEVVDWATSTRRALAVEIGACLGSAEAVAVCAAPAGSADPVAIKAAADIAAHVLAAISQSIDEGWQVRQRSSAIQTEVPVRAAPVAVTVARHIDVR